MVRGGRPVVGVFLALVAAAAVAWWAGSGPTGALGAGREAHRVDDGVAPVVPADADAALGPDPTSLARAPEGRPPVPPTDEFADEGPPGHLRIDGVVRTRDGSPVPATGWIAAAPADGRIDPFTSSEVISGRFRLWIAAPGRYRVETLTFRGEPYRGALDAVELAAATSWELVVEPTREGVVDVVDAESGQPLADARAVLRPAADDDSAVATELPNAPSDVVPVLVFPDADDEADALRSDAHGRLVVPAAWGTARKLRIGAPSHAWQDVDVPLGRSAATTVRLVRAGSLDVRVRGLDAGARFAVVGTSSDGRQVRIPVRDGDGRLVDGFPPGTWRLVVTDVEGDGEGGGEATATVDVDRRSKVVIECASPTPIPATFAVAGTIVVPSGWIEPGDPIRVHVRRLDGDAAGRAPLIDRRLMLRGTPAAPMPLEIGEVPRGTYAFEVEGIPWLAEVVIARSTASLRIAVPPPIDATFALVDAATGAPIEPTALHWAQAGSPFPRTWADASPRERGTVVVRVPASTPGRLYVRARGFLAGDPAGFHEIGGPSLDCPAFAPLPARPRREVALRRAAMLRVDVRGPDGAPEVAVVLLHAPGMRASSPLPLALGDERTRPYDVEPGHWVLELAVDASRFAPVLPQELDLVGGETTVVTVDLVRAR